MLPTFLAHQRAGQGAPGRATGKTTKKAAAAERVNNLVQIHEISF
jgi:hypothetical protein